MTVVPYKSNTQGGLEVPRDWVALMPSAVELAKAVANTEFVPGGLRGNPAAITAAILYGDEVGLGPMQALAKIAVIDGKPSLAAEAQRALILAAGHEIWIEEATTSRVTVAGRRRDSDQTNRFTWTLDDARRAGLNGKPNWRRYPRQMLVARASAELARAVFADAIGGLAATEELEELVDADGAPVADTPEAKPPANRRRRPQRAPAATVTAPAPEPPAEPPQPPLPGEQEPQQAMMSDAQRRRLFALFRERGISDRGERLKISSRLLGRELKSANDLTEMDADKLMDALATQQTDDPGEPGNPEDSGDSEQATFRIPDDAKPKPSAQGDLPEGY
jgi:hypothetical protein